MTQPFRLSSGGVIDRARPIVFSFNDKPYQGYAGDTLASALLANGVHLVARSLRYHRPRGILTSGPEEPCALLTVEDAYGSTPNLKATEVALKDDLKVRSQNHWPDLTFDIAGLLQPVTKFLGAGFYYKTFMWPRSGWHHLYEPFLRRMAGQGTTDMSRSEALYDKQHLHCDIAIIGAGATGLAAALSASRSGISTILLEQDRQLGGSLTNGQLPDSAGQRALTHQNEATLRNSSHVRILSQTLACGAYDHGRVNAVTLHDDGPTHATFWKIRARRIIVATGAFERPLVFPDNDRPGIMLAGAVRSYIRRWAVRPGNRAIVAVASASERNDTIACLNAAGIEVVATVNSDDRIVSTRGRHRIKGLTIERDGGSRHQFPCDLLCVSAGWSAASHLFAHVGGQLAFDNTLESLVPVSQSPFIRLAGGARGLFNIDDAVVDGETAVSEFVDQSGATRVFRKIKTRTAVRKAAQFAGRTNAFVDFQNDVTRHDIAQAVREGYRDIELVKRYTTLGMGTDQGKTSWSNAILELASCTNQKPDDIGHTRFRPMMSPVPIGALVGAETDANLTPVRRTPFHRVFETMGCVFETSGAWHYSRCFPNPGESMAAATEREVRAVRHGLGFVDMSTLGKIEVRGRDSLCFLSRVFCNDLDKLQPGRLRYALMLREDGMVLDDGVVAQLTDDRFLVTTTTANSDAVWLHLQKLAQVNWPDLDVTLIKTSEQWASLAVAGPRAREFLALLEPDFPVDRTSFPFAAVREGKLGGDLPARLFTVSYSGEMACEINVPAGLADTLIDRVMTCGARWKITPYGLAALDVLRIEKGHIAVGTEIDGRRTPADLGLAGLVSRKKDFIGRALLQRPALQARDRPSLVGVRPVDGKSQIPAGAHLVSTITEDGSGTSLGYLTATIFSPTLVHPVALAFLKNGAAHHGAIMLAVSPVADKTVEVEVSGPRFLDPKGERLRV